MSLSVRKQAQLTGHNAAIFSLHVIEDANTFLSAAGDGWVVTWDRREPDLGRLIAKAGTQLFSLAYLPAENTVVAGDMNGGVHWLTLNDDSQNKHIAHHKKGTFAVMALSDAVYTVGGGGMLTRWHRATQRTQESIYLSNQSLRCMAYSEARRELAVGSSDNSIYLVDAQHLTVRERIADAHDNSVFSLTYAPDGQRLFSGGRDAHLRVWDLSGGQARPMQALPAHWFTLNSIKVSPNGRWLATASRDKTIKLWDMATLELLKVLEGQRDGGHFNSVNDLLWLPGGHQLVSAGDDRSIIVWEVGEDE